MASLTPGQVSALGTTQVQTLPPAAVVALSTPQVAALTESQLSVLSTSQLSVLSTSQLAALSSTQLAAMSPAQVQALSPTQVRTLSPVQLANFTVEQVIALQASGVLGVAQAPASGVVSPLASGSSMDAPVLSPTALLSASKVALSTADSVLSVAVIGGATGGNTGVSITKQDSATFKLQLVNVQPSAPVSSLLLNVPLSTVETRNAKNEPVLYGAGLSGDKLVLAAPNESARQMMRAELLKMVAGAIDTLGSAGAVPLDTIKGIVLDMR